MLGPVLVFLQAEPLARRHADAFDLVAGCLCQHLIPAPWPQAAHRGRRWVAAECGRQLLRCDRWCKGGQGGTALQTVGLLEGQKIVLSQGLVHPGLHAGQGAHPSDISGDHRGHWQGIGFQAHADGRVVGIGHRKIAKQHGAAMLAQQFLPHGDQARQIAAHAGLVAPDQRASARQRGLDVHRAMAAQLAKAAVHFGADAARPGPRRH